MAGSEEGSSYRDLPRPMQSPFAQQELAVGGAIPFAADVGLYISEQIDAEGRETLAESVELNQGVCHHQFHLVFVATPLIFHQPDSWVDLKSRHSHSFRFLPRHPLGTIGCLQDWHPGQVVVQLPSHCCLSSCGEQDAAYLAERADGGNLCHYC